MECELEDNSGRGCLLLFVQLSGGGGWSFVFVICYFVSERVLMVPRSGLWVPVVEISLKHLL